MCGCDRTWSEDCCTHNFIKIIVCNHTLLVVNLEDLQSGFGVIHVELPIGKWNKVTKPVLILTCKNVSPSLSNNKYLYINHKKTFLHENTDKIIIISYRPTNVGQINKLTNHVIQNLDNQQYKLFNIILISSLGFKQRLIYGTPRNI